MKTMIRKEWLMILSAVVLIPLFAGCYTEVGSLRSEREDTYGYDNRYESKIDSSGAEVNNYYGGYPPSYGLYDGYLPYPRYRAYFSYYYPSYYWTPYNDPFFYDCYYFYDPWICGSPFMAYGIGFDGFYHPFGFFGTSFRYSPFFHGYVASGKVFSGSRNFGSTRGIGGRGSFGSSRGTTSDYTPPPATSVGGRGVSSTTSGNSNAGRSRSEGTTRGSYNQGNRTEDKGSGRQGGETRGSGRGNSGSYRGGGNRSQGYYYFIPPRFQPGRNPSYHSAPSYSSPSTNSGGSRGSSGGGHSSGGSRGENSRGR